MYGKWVGTWLYEHPYCTDIDIVLFLNLLANVLIVSRFWIKTSAKCPRCKCDALIIQFFVVKRFWCQCDCDVAYIYGKASMFLYKQERLREKGKWAELERSTFSIGPLVCIETATSMAEQHIFKELKSLQELVTMGFNTTWV